MPDVKLFNNDCLIQMPNIPDKSIDMILADLPYGVTQNKDDKPINLSLLWKQYERIIKDNGAIVLFSQGVFYIDLVDSNRKLFRYDLIWNKELKSGFLNAKKMPLRQHEQIAVFYKKPPSYNPQFSSGQPLHSKGYAYINKEIVNNNYGKYSLPMEERDGSIEKYPTSILSFQKPHPSVAKHRTEKPISLCEYLIRTYSNEGDTILDNVMGSGSTIVAAYKCGRNSIGIEKDKEIFDMAQCRINEEINKMEGK